MASKTAASLDYVGILRVELFTGNALLMDKDMVSAYVEIKIDGEVKQSYETARNDYQFNQVFHYHLHAGKRTRELQILVCNINRGGYVQKNTIVRTKLDEIELPINTAVDYRPHNIVKGRKTTICCSLTFLNNLFVQNIQGSIQLTLIQMQPPKGILALSLGTHEPVYTAVAGSRLVTKNESPYCKVVMLYYENEQIKDYLGSNRVKLMRTPTSDRMELFLCDLNWVSSNEGYKFTTDRLFLAKKAVTVRLELLLIPPKQEALIQQPLPSLPEIKKLKRVTHITQVKLIGFPYEILQNPKLCVCFITDHKLYYSSQKQLPVWKTDLVVPSGHFRGMVYDCLSTNYKDELAIIDGEEVELSKFFLERIKVYFSSNRHKYNEILEKQVRCEIESEFFETPFTDNPVGMVSVSQNEYYINDFVGQGNFITQSVHDYISIRKIVGRQLEKQIDVPIYQLNFPQAEAHVDNDKIMIYFEPDLDRKILLSADFKHEESNYAKLIVYTLEIAKNPLDSVEVCITANNQTYKTSKSHGKYFGQDFVIPFPSTLSISVMHYVEREQNQYLQDSFYSILNLSHLKTLSSQFINVHMASGNKEALLTLKLDLSGKIENFQKLTLTPICQIQPSTLGEYFIKIYESFRCISILNQRGSSNEDIKFDDYIFHVDSIYKPLRMELCYTSGNDYQQCTILQEVQILAFELNFQLRNFYQFGRISLHIKRELDFARTIQLKLPSPDVEPCRTFLMFTLLDIVCMLEQSEDMVIGCAVQLKHLQSDSVDRLRDKKAFQSHGGIFEYDRTEINCLNQPISTQMINQSCPFSLIKLHKLGNQQNMTFYVKILLGQLETRDGVYFQEITDEKGRPILIKYRVSLIRHFRFNLNQNLELTLITLKTHRDKSVQVAQVNLEESKWIIGTDLQGKYESTDFPITYNFEDIECSIEFTVFSEQTLYKRYTLNLQETPFDYNSKTGVGTFDLDVDGVKCTLQISESKLPIEQDINKKLSINALSRLKTLAGRFQTFKFYQNLEKYQFNHSLKYTFINYNPTYVSQMLGRVQRKYPEVFEYNLLSIKQEQFPIYSSVGSIFLGKKQLTLLEYVETRDQDAETILQTDIVIREVNICTKDPKVELTYFTKDGVQQSLDQAHIKYSKVQSPVTIGKFTFTFIRLLKLLMPDYQNKPVIDTGPIHIKIKYNRQKYLIRDITQIGLLSDGMFRDYSFFISNIEDTMLVSVLISDFLVAQAELCVATSFGRFLLPIPAIRYQANDILFHFHKKIAPRDLWLMGTIEFQKLDWVKVFIKLEELQVALTDELSRNNYYTFGAENNDYFWTSKVYPQNASKFTIKFEPNDILEQLVDEQATTAYLKLFLKRNGETLAERFVSLKPFVARNNQIIQFPIKMSDEVTLMALFEVRQVFKSSMKQKKPQVRKDFDFRKLTYDELLLLILNFEVDIVRGLQEFFEFLMYNLPEKYQPKPVFQVLYCLFTCYREKRKIAQLTLQSLVTLYLSHEDDLEAEMETIVPLLMQYAQEIVMQEHSQIRNYDKQFGKLVQLEYVGENPPIMYERLESLENIEIPSLQGYLLFNNHKALEDIFEDDQNELNGKIVVSIFKLFDNFIDEDIKRSMDMLRHLPILMRAYQVLDKHSETMGLYFCSFINTLLKQYNDRELENYLTASQLDNFSKEVFQSVQDVIFEQISVASEKEFLSMFQTLGNLIKITKTGKDKFLRLGLNQMDKSMTKSKDLEVHIGILVDYFTADNSAELKTVLPSVELEAIAIKAFTYEFTNTQESTTAANLFDIILFSIELGYESRFGKLQEFLTKYTPSQELNKVAIEKFLLFLKRREDKAQRLQMMKEKQAQSEAPKDINERKKQLMEKYMISKLSWK